MSVGIRREGPVAPPQGAPELTLSLQEGSQPQISIELPPLVLFLFPFLIMVIQIFDCFEGCVAFYCNLKNIIKMIYCISFKELSRNVEQA